MVAPGWEGVFGWGRGENLVAIPFSKDRKVLLRITLVLTYLLTYLRTSHPTLKFIKQKMSKISQVNVPYFFHFAKIQKMTKLGPKRTILGPKNQN